MRSGYHGLSCVNTQLGFDSSSHFYLVVRTDRQTVRRNSSAYGHASIKFKLAVIVY